MEIFIKDLATADEKTLFEVLQAISAERKRRELKKKEQLVSNFKEAFRALINAGYNITYDDVDLYIFDSFEFN